MEMEFMMGVPDFSIRTVEREHIDALNEMMEELYDSLGMGKPNTIYLGDVQLLGDEHLTSLLLFGKITISDSHIQRCKLLNPDMIHFFIDNTWKTVTPYIVHQHILHIYVKNVFLRGVHGT